MSSRSTRPRLFTRKAVKGSGFKIQEQLVEDLGDRGILIDRVLLRDVALPGLIQQAIESKIAAEQAIQERRFRVSEAEEEARRRVAEAEGQKNAQQLINSTLTPAYLQFLYIQNLAAQKEGNVIYVPVNPGTGLPVFVNAGSAGAAGAVASKKRRARQAGSGWRERVFVIRGRPRPGD